MRYDRDDPARYERAKRRKLIEAGKIPGLFVPGSKKLHPEVKALIDSAIARKANGL
ncbi:hypothetical protein WOC76_08935 [Methylocystis sp. IM3]|jgi:hypothetical protein|uniref:hypothetical protein n=1 Tax=unclassified Methylocystis TaxID=2625913 RepID=UPI0026CF8C90